MRIVYMGTPELAAVVLQSLLDSRHEVVCVVTQPDRPKGRGKAVAMSPVKELAVAHEIPVLQPEKMREPGVLEALDAYQADVFCVAAFGQILPAKILALPKYGCINVHASLLPKYRGAAPIQYAVLNGEAESGVTTMFMSRGLDKGDMLLKETVQLDPKETGDSLHDRLAAMGGPLLIKTLEALEAGTLERIPQNDEESSYASMLSKKDGLLDWREPAAVLERKVRGLTSWPGAYGTLNGRTLKLWETEVIPANEEEAVNCGTVVRVDKDLLAVSCGKDLLSIRSLQPVGKKRMPIDAFLRGYPVKAGDCFSLPEDDKE